LSLKSKEINFRKFVSPVIISLLASLVAFIGLLWFTAQQLDLRILQKERSIIKNALEAKLEANEIIANDSAEWDAAFKNIVLQYNQEWIASTYGDMNSDIMLIDGVTISNFKSEYILAHFSLGSTLTTDKIDTTGFQKSLSKRFAHDVPHRVPHAQIKRSDIFLQDNSVLLSSSSEIRPQAGKKYPDEIKLGDHAILTYIEIISQKEWAEMGNQIAIESLHFVPYDQMEGEFFPIDNNDGRTLGGLKWSRSTPGTSLMQDLILPSFIFLLIVMVVIYKFIIQTKKFMVSLQTADQAKSSFIARMSHEIKTPLNSIMGFTDVLLNEAHNNDDKDDNSLSFLKEIKKSSHHLMVMLHDILTMSKLESGQLDVFIDDVSPRHIVKNCLQKMSSSIKEKKLHIENTCKKTMVITDANILEQTFSHILSNAVKFTPTGGTITIRSHTDSNGLFNLYIIDSGLGMTEQEIEQALDLFSQLEAVNTRISEGTGLGLSLVDRLMKRIDGCLHISSVPKKGTSVRLSFPSRSDDQLEQRI